MEDRLPLPWPPRTAVAVLILVGLVWLVGLGLALASALLGGLVIALALWLTVGLICTAWRSPRRSAS